MSVAFTRDEDLEATAADLPDRPISPHPNLVTPSGLALIEAALASARAAYAAAQAKGDIEADRTAMARATRDLRYWSARRATAQLVETEPEGRVRFGGSVTLERADGRTQTWRITGEDEADPAVGSVSHVSPLAVALMGKQVGDEAVVAAEHAADGDTGNGHRHDRDDAQHLPIVLGERQQPQQRKQGRKLSRQLSKDLITLGHLETLNYHRYRMPMQGR
jgi:transcription elongation GreA/GreB family factor